MKELTCEEMNLVHGGDYSCVIGSAGLAFAIIGGAMTGGAMMLIGLTIGVASWQDGCFN